MNKAELPKHGPNDLLSAPDRSSMLSVMLERSRRGAVPIRNEFIQKQGRAGVLSTFVRSRDSAALDAYLLVHAVASAAPWQCKYPLSTWALASGYLATATGISARARFSKVLQRLEDRRLLSLQEKGWRPVITLLREDCSGEAYFRPRSAADGVWFSVPYSYWNDGFMDKLTLPAKAMLLIAMSSKEGFELPFDRVSDWYGISPKSAERGIKELTNAHVLSYERDFRVEPRSAIGVAEVRRYQLENQFSIAARRESMRRVR